MTSALRLLSIFVVLACFPGEAFAHRQPEMVTTIHARLDTTGEAFAEVTHRIHAHDALQLIPIWTAADAANFDDPEILEQLAAKLAAQLTLSEDSRVIGSELVGNFFYVYVVADPGAAVTKSVGLSDLDANWVHQVNIQGSDGVTSHTFSESRGRVPSDRTTAP